MSFMIWSRIFICLTFAVGMCAGFLLRTPKFESSGLPPNQEEMASDAKKKLQEYYEQQRITKISFLKAKLRVFDEVLAGNCSLTQAAMVFRALDEVDLTFDERGFFDSFPGRSMTERYCKEVIAYIRDRVLHVHDPRADAVLERFEKELNELLQKEKSARDESPSDE